MNWWTSMFEDLPRNERRLALRAEEKARKTGAWGGWVTIPVTPGMIAGRGWPQQVSRAHRNRCFCVLERPLPDGTLHLAVSSLSQRRPSWWEMQRIKNEIAWEDVTAVEVYPPQAEVVDGAEMFHIWVLPAPLPFSLWHDGRSSIATAA